MPRDYSALLEHPTDLCLLIDPETRVILKSNKQAFSAEYKLGQEFIPHLVGWKKGNFVQLKKALEEDGIYRWCENDQWLGAQTIKSNKDVWLIRFAPSAKHTLELLENNVTGYYRIGIDGIIIDCNESFAKILGYGSSKELIGMDVEELYAKKKERDLFLKKLRKEARISNYEILLKSKSGDEVWCLENSFLEQKKPYEIISGTLIDISDLKQAEGQYRELFNTSTDAILILDKNGILDCNSVSVEVFGYTREEIKALKPFDFKKGLIRSDDNDVDMYLHKFEQALGGEPQKSVMRCRRKDGSAFHAEVKLSAFKSAGKTNIQAIVRDISDRVIFERAIRESEERFRMISNVAIEGVVFIAEETIIDSNDQLARLFTFTHRDEVIGKKISEFIRSEDFDRILSMLKIRSLGKIEIRANTRTGEVLFLETSGSFISYQGQEVIVLMLYDITARKRAEQALEQSIERFKNLVENSPNAVFILTDYLIKYTNQSGLALLGFRDEDIMYDQNFLSFFDQKTSRIVKRDLDDIRNGKNVDYKELKLINDADQEVDIGMKISLTIYDNRPSIQVTVNNLSTRMLLLQEQVRAQLAEEINAILKKEIEEHKVTQQKLQAAQTFARNIIESSIDMIIAVDKNYKITEFNAAAQEQFGYKQKEIIGKSASTLYADSAAFNMVKTSLAESGTYSGEIIHRKKDKKTFTCLLSASLIKTQTGEIVGSMGVSRDITEIKKAEQELRESEERYRDIFDNATDFILSVDSKGKFIYANDAFRSTLGYKESELRKLSIRKVTSEYCLDQNKTLYECFVSDNLNVVFEAKDGHKIIAEGDSSIRYKDGKPHSIRAIFRDVTETRRQEHEAIAQKAKLESIFDSTENMMMWTLDKDYRITSCNKNFIGHMKEVFDANVKMGNNYLEKIQKHLNQDLHQGQLDSFKEAFKGRPQQFELPLLTKKKRPIWLQVFLNPVYIDGALLEVSCLTYDVTDRIEIDRKIRDSLKEKEVLLQEVHHRVKNNLQVISSILNLQSSFVEDQKTLEILRESQERIKSMSFIHETLYRTSDFTSIEFTDYIDTLTRNLVQSYMITSSGVKLETDFDEIYLSLDQAIPCGLIVNELVSNALKYAFVNVKHPKLTIRVKEIEGKIELLVRDNGVGLPADFKYQDSDSLGIQLVYTLSEQLDAELEVTSKGGTSFLITFDKQ
jgi:PAS domain S-box-containing protein